MKKSLYLITLAASVSFLSGCANRFAYPHEPGVFSVIASASSAKKSEERAVTKATFICQYYGHKTQIKGIYRMENVYLNKAIKTPTQYIFVADKTHDFTTIVQASCIDSTGKKAQLKEK